jgi:hypothetical protein
MFIFASLNNLVMVLLSHSVNVNMAHFLLLSLFLWGSLFLFLMSCSGFL